MLLHPDDVQNFKIAEQTAYWLAVGTGKCIKTFEPKRRPLAGGALGVCYCNERRISVVFRWRHPAGDGRGWYKKPLSMEEVLKTVAHEVAHLTHPNHSKEFKELEKKLLVKVQSTIDNPVVV